MIEGYKWSSLMQPFLAGSFSATCSTTLFQPFELVKTRLQMTCIDHTQVKTGSMLKIAGQIVRNESVFGLWRGLCPPFQNIQLTGATWQCFCQSLGRTVPGVGLYFTALHCLTIQFGSSQPLPASESLLFGASARSVSAIVTIPFAVIKTRYESGVFPYRSIVGAFRVIYRNEGIKGLSSGLGVTLIKDVPFSALYLMFYNQLKMAVIREERVGMETNPVVLFVCGTIAGCIASVVTHPPDVVKTHLQLYPNRFSKSWQTFIHIFQTDGLRGFFRGLLPRLLRRTLMTAMSWTVYEQAMIFLQVKRK